MTGLEYEATLNEFNEKISDPLISLEERDRYISERDNFEAQHGLNSHDLNEILSRPQRTRRRRILQTRKTKKDNILIEVKIEDWIQAKKEWGQLHISDSSRRTMQNLLPKQIGLLAQFKKNPKSIIGEPVIIAYTPTGEFWQDFPYPATILKCVENNGYFRFTVQFHPIEEEKWNEDRIEEVEAYQIIPLKTFVIPKQKIDKKAKPSVFDELLPKINGNIGSQLGSLTQRKAEYQQSIQSHLRDIEKYKEETEKINSQIQDTQNNALSEQEIKKRIDDTANVKGVHHVGVTRDGIMLLETKMLYAISSKTDKVTRHQIGRFVFHINLYNGSIYGQNLDYMDDLGHGHPNISGTSVCFGNNQAEVRDFVLRAKFADLADFLILFFSLFGHGSPYISHSDWLRRRKKTPQQNQWESLPFVYQVDGTAPESREYKKKGFLAKLTKKTRGRPRKTPKESEIVVADNYDDILDENLTTLTETMINNVVGRDFPF